MSSYKTESYLWVDDLSTEGTQQLFSRAQTLKHTLNKGQRVQTLLGKQIALVFSEASTRTKMSFQMAAQRLGGQCLVIDNVSSSSMSKGETFADTFWTLHAIKPDAFVIRCGGGDPLDQITPESSIPVINAGFGSHSHPTQALLDLFTMQEHFGRLDGLKVLFVGDIDHSRVASSDIKLLKAFGAEVKVCAPESFYQKTIKGVENIANLKEAIQWCNVYVGLRVQFERHVQAGAIEDIKKEFTENYSLNSVGLSCLNQGAVIMHPGPVNWGVEFASEVQEDSRLLMWKQKENGVYTRAALMEKVLKVNQ